MCKTEKKRNTVKIQFRICQFGNWQKDQQDIFTENSFKKF